MDEFAQLSRENFEVFQRYGDCAGGPDPKHRAIAVHTSPGSEPTTYVERDLRLDHLPKFFGARPTVAQNTAEAGVGVEAGAQRAASLKLVVIDSTLESWSNFSSSLLTKIPWRVGKQFARALKIIFQCIQLVLVQVGKEIVLVLKSLCVECSSHLEKPRITRHLIEGSERRR